MSVELFGVGNPTDEMAGNSPPGKEIEDHRSDLVVEMGLACDVLFLGPVTCRRLVCVFDPEHIWIIRLVELLSFALVEHSQLFHGSPS